jgi:hypothetical protein
MADELRTLNPEIISSLVINGDLKRLSPIQKVEYYNYRCQQAGLDPSAKPFDLLSLNGKEILYANASCTQQLTSIHKLSHTITAREVSEGVYCVFCRVTGPDGRSTENMGAVPVEGLKGDAKANAMLKATTKAIRRSVLAHMGLGMMDETEVETIPGAVVSEIIPDDKPKGTLAPPPQTDGWSVDEQSAYVSLLDDLYKLYKEGGHPEKYEEQKAKWDERKKSDPSTKVLKGLKDFIMAFKSAIAAEKAKKAATHPPPPEPAKSEPPPIPPPMVGPDEPKPSDPEFPEFAKKAYNDACERFERAYKEAGATDPHAEAVKIRDKTKALLQFQGGESKEEKILALAKAMQGYGDKMRIPK